MFKIVEYEFGATPEEVIREVWELTNTIECEKIVGECDGEELPAAIALLGPDNLLIILNTLLQGALCTTPESTHEEYAARKCRQLRIEMLAALGINEKPFKYTT